MAQQAQLKSAYLVESDGVMKEKLLNYILVKWPDWRVIKRAPSTTDWKYWWSENKKYLFLKFNLSSEKIFE